MKSIITAVLLFTVTTLSAEPAKRIVSVGGAVTEIIFALGEGDRVIGNDTTSIFPEQAASLPKVGYQRALSAEGVLSLNPDLIFLSEEAGPPAVIKQLETAGMNIIKIDTRRSVDDVKTAIKTIAAALDQEDKADKVIAKINQDTLRLQNSKQRGRQPQKVLFVLSHGGGAPMVAGSGTSADSIIKLSGGVNVVTDYEGYKPLTPEAAVALNPDVILTTTQGLEQVGGKQKFLAKPGLSLTPAARLNNVIAMDALIMLGFGPRIVEAAIQLNEAYTQL